MTSIVRMIALPIVSAGILGGAALGLAGMANASAGLGGQEPSGPGYSFSPNTHATPAPTVKPGWHHNHGHHYIVDLTGADQA